MPTISERGRVMDANMPKMVFLKLDLPPQDGTVCHHIKNDNTFV